MPRNPNHTGRPIEVKKQDVLSFAAHVNTAKPCIRVKKTLRKIGCYLAVPLVGTWAALFTSAKAIILRIEELTHRDNRPKNPAPLPVTVTKPEIRRRRTPP